MTYGEHPRDGVRACTRCGAHAPHAYNGAQIFEGADLDAAPAGPVEVLFFTCGACRSTWTLVHEPRPDLGPDEIGWVTDRRETPRSCETVRPGAA